MRFRWIQNGVWSNAQVLTQRQNDANPGCASVRFRDEECMDARRDRPFQSLPTATGQ